MFILFIKNEMESYIQITKLNDFIFCPKSLYFHGMFNDFEEKTYHDKPQIVGKIKHETIEEGKYSTKKNVLQATEVFSEKYGLCGKIDTFDLEKGVLTERKYRVKQVYLGFKYQLYAQMFCLEEMGHKVKKLALYSMSDNKMHQIDLPSKEEKREFEELVDRVKKFKVLKEKVEVSEEKCKMCIYKSLCH
jgi:CRISPR-associated exonuclease Cas4